MKYLMVALAVVCLVPAATAQSTDLPPESAEEAALRNCTALADAGKGADAEVPGRLAEAGYQRRLGRNPNDVEALVGAARAMSQCLVPSASLLRQGELSSEAMELLDRALEIRPDHWLARFVLASIAFRSPSFLGRGKRAAQELDELLREPDQRVDDRMLARVFAMRGQLLSREGKTDSAHVLWERGLALFPEDRELQRLVHGREPSPPPVEPRPAARDSANGVTALATVQVTASSAQPKAPLPSMKEMSRSEVLLTPGGAADVLQLVQMQPGATRVGEGGDVYTRAGDAGETSLIVNGGRVLSLARFEGLSGSLFGAIEPYVVKSVRYSSGGFSARHGNALSGVLEIETDGRPRERATRAGLSLVQASGTVRVPLNSRMGGWINSRFSHTGALLKTHGRAGEFSGAPQSREAIASLIAAPTPFTELRVTGIVESDVSRRYITAAGWRGSFDSEGANRAAMLSFRWVSSSAPVILRGNVAGSSRSTDWTFGVLSRDRRESGGIARVDVEWEARDGLTLRAGAEQGAHRRLESGTVPATQSVAPGAPTHTLDETRARADQLGGYTEAELAMSAVSITAGLRADRLPGETETTLDPRLAIQVRRGEWTTRLSGGVFHQGRWRGDAAIPDEGTPSGLPRTASHVVLGLERTGPAGFVRAELFAKRYSAYGAFGAGPAIESSDVRGFDALAQRSSGPVTGFVGYSLLDAQSRLTDGRRVRGAFDVTHSATASITAATGTDWSLGTTARYGSGAPRTPIIGGQPTADGRTEPVYGTLMSERLPAYARLDARVMRYFRYSSVLVTSFVEVLNVTGRANVSTWTYDPTYTSRDAVYSFFSRRTLVAGAEFMFR